MVFNKTKEGARNPWASCLTGINVEKKQNSYMSPPT